MRVGAALLALLTTGPGCKGSGEEAGAASPPKPAGVAPVAQAPVPQRPRPRPLPDGMCCCDATVRNDRLVQVVAEATCQALAGRCTAVEACWLPDPPQVSGAAPAAP